eukprot:6454905-Amphidinium_carterae.1
MLAHELEDRHRQIETMATAMEYVDGTLKPGVVRPHLEEGIKLAQQVQGKIFDEFRYDLKKRFEEECRRLNIPDESDVQTVLKEIRELQEKEASVRQRVEQLRLATTYTVKASTEDDDDSGCNDETDADEDSPPTLAVHPHRAEQSLVGLKTSLHDLEIAHAQKEKELARHYNVLNTAERTIKAMEEAKTVFLETIAVEEPRILAEDQSFKRNEKLLREPTSGVNDDEDLAKNGEAMSELRREMNRLLLELSGYEVKFNAADVQPLPA